MTCLVFRLGQVEVWWCVDPLFALVNHHTRLVGISIKPFFGSCSTVLEIVMRIELLVDEVFGDVLVITSQINLLLFDGLVKILFSIAFRLALGGYTATKMC